MGQTLSRRALMGAARAIPFMAVAGLPAGAISKGLDDEWAQVIAVRPHDPKLLEVIQRATAEGHLHSEMTQVAYVCPGMPDWAPALYFTKPNGDEVVVSQHGTQTTFARPHRAEDREWGDFFGSMDKLHPFGRESARQARLAGMKVAWLQMVITGGAFAYDDAPRLMFEQPGGKLVMVGRNGVV